MAKRKPSGDVFKSSKRKEKSVVDNKPKKKVNLQLK